MAIYSKYKAWHAIALSLLTGIAPVINKILPQKSILREKAFKKRMPLHIHLPDHQLYSLRW